MEKFSVLMSVYEKENAEYFDLSLESITKTQTILPNEIVIVKDGPLTDSLEKVIEKYDIMYKGLFKIVPLKENIGLGKALSIGLDNCTNEIVMRMDTDDVAVENRFEIQLDYMCKHKEIVACGGYIAEFQNEYVTESKRIKRMPITCEDVIK